MDLAMYGNHHPIRKDRTPVLNRQERYTLFVQ